MHFRVQVLRLRIGGQLAQLGAPASRGGAFVTPLCQRGTEDAISAITASAIITLS